MAETLRFRVASGCCAECAGDVTGTPRALPGVAHMQIRAAPTSSAWRTMGV
jgi:hypothetical protein